jgi:hypothetical protein
VKSSVRFVAARGKSASLRRASMASSLRQGVGDAMDAALLLIDLINPLDFEGAEKLIPHARRAAAAMGAARRHRSS